MQSLRCPHPPDTGHADLHRRSQFDLIADERSATSRLSSRRSSAPSTFRKIGNDDGGDRRRLLAGVADSLIVRCSRLAVPEDLGAGIAPRAGSLISFELASRDQLTQLRRSLRADSTLRQAVE